MTALFVAAGWTLGLMVPRLWLTPIVAGAVAATVALTFEVELTGLIALVLGLLTGFSQIAGVATRDWLRARNPLAPRAPKVRISESTDRRLDIGVRIASQ